MSADCGEPLFITFNRDSQTIMQKLCVEDIHYSLEIVFMDKQLNSNVFQTHSIHPHQTMSAPTATSHPLDSFNGLKRLRGAF